MRRALRATTLGIREHAVMLVGGVSQALLHAAVCLAVWGAACVLLSQGWVSPMCFRRVCQFVLWPATGFVAAQCEMCVWQVLVGTPRLTQLAVYRYNLSTVAKRFNLRVDDCLQNCGCATIANASCARVLPWLRSLPWHTVVICLLVLCKQVPLAVLLRLLQALPLAAQRLGCLLSCLMLSVLQHPAGKLV